MAPWECARSQGRPSRVTAAVSAKLELECRFRYSCITRGLVRSRGPGTAVVLELAYMKDRTLQAMNLLLLIHNWYSCKIWNSDILELGHYTWYSTYLVQIKG